MKFLLPVPALMDQQEDQDQKMQQEHSRITISQLKFSA
jgi:hypothetical protein